jgi:hypothetical protein
MTFIRFFNRNLKFGSKFGLRTCPLSGAVVRCGAGAASRQPMRDGAGSGMARQLIGHPQAVQREDTGASDQVSHSWTHYEKIQYREDANFFLLPSTFYLSCG